MAHIILKLKRNEETGKQDLIIDYESEGDALPFEHEEEHLAIVKKVLEDQGLEIIGDVGTIQVGREPVHVEDLQTESPEKQQQKLKN